MVALQAVHVGEVELLLSGGLAGHAPDHQHQVLAGHGVAGQVNALERILVRGPLQGVHGPGSAGDGLAVHAGQNRRDGGAGGHAAAVEGAVAVAFQPALVQSDLNIGGHPVFHIGEVLSLAGNLGIGGISGVNGVAVLVGHNAHSGVGTAVGALTGGQVGIGGSSRLSTRILHRSLSGILSLSGIISGLIRIPLGLRSLIRGQSLVILSVLAGDIAVPRRTQRAAGLAGAGQSHKALFLAVVKTSISVVAAAVILGAAGNVSSGGALRVSGIAQALRDIAATDGMVSLVALVQVTAAHAALHVLLAGSGRATLSVSKPGALVGASRSRAVSAAGALGGRILAVVAVTTITARALISGLAGVAQRIAGGRILNGSATSLALVRMAVIGAGIARASAGNVIVTTAGRSSVFLTVAALIISRSASALAIPMLSRTILLTVRLATVTCAAIRASSRKRHGKQRHHHAQRQQDR